jgi:hypothetical protein
LKKDLKKEKELSEKFKINGESTSSNLHNKIHNGANGTNEINGTNGTNGTNDTKGNHLDVKKLEKLLEKTQNVKTIICIIKTLI